MPTTAPHAETSWLSLLASSSLGLERLSTTRVEVTLGQARLGAGQHRLVVQSYARKPDRNERPLGSCQRIVTAAELRRGVSVPLIELGSGAVDEPYVLAWVEAQSSLLELDGRRARPSGKGPSAMTRATRGKNPVRLALG